MTIECESNLLILFMNTIMENLNNELEGNKENEIEKILGEYDWKMKVGALGGLYCVEKDGKYFLLNTETNEKYEQKTFFDNEGNIAIVPGDTSVVYRKMESK